MIEETGTSECVISHQVLVMDVSKLHGDLRRSRDTDVTSSGTFKRRRLDSQDQENGFQLQYHSRSDLDTNFHEHVLLTAMSGDSDHVSSFFCSVNADLRSDLKAKCVSETGILMSSNDDLSTETSTSSVVSLESEDMESLSTSTPKKKKLVGANKATSGRKPSPARSPSPAELEEFFSEAEKYEQKRFEEKYNYDIGKDVPVEGRYHWVRLKP